MEVVVEVEVVVAVDAGVVDELDYFKQENEYPFALVSTYVVSVFIWQTVANVPFPVTLGVAVPQHSLEAQTELSFEQS